MNIKKGGDPIKLARIVGMIRTTVIGRVDTTFSSSSLVRTHGNYDSGGYCNDPLVNAQLMRKKHSGVREE